jgi:hypothetical protein
MFVLRLAGLESVHHLENEILCLLIAPPFGIQTIALKPVFPEYVDCFVHLAGLVAPAVTRNFDVIVLFRQPADNARHPHERHSHATPQHEVEIPQKDSRSQTKHRLGDSIPAVALHLRLAESCAGACTAQLSKAGDCAQKCRLQPVVFRAEKRLSRAGLIAVAIG